MSKQNILSRPKVNQSQSRNGFDRSCRKAINMSAGMLLPVEWRPCIKGTTLKLNRKCFIRSADVNTAAFSPLDFHMEYFKVPLRLLWSHWYDFKLNIQDVNSTALFSVLGQQDMPSVPPTVPYFDINEFERFLHVNIATNLNEFDTRYGQTSAMKDSMGFLYANGYFRLKDLLRYGSYGTPNEDITTDKPAFDVNPFPILAYQKIYFDYFRNTSYEANDPYAYNVDWVDPVNGYIDVNDKQDIIRRWFELRYVNYRNDYFNNVYPALNYVSSLPQGNNWTIPTTVTSLHGIPSLISNSVYTGGYLTAQNATSNRVTTVQNIRAAFALDKLMRASAYAPKHVRDQFKARFGVEMDERVSSECERIGSFMTDIKLMEVTSSADTEHASLGAIGAKGIGVGDSGQTIETYCDEDCIVMAVAYILPRTSYDAYGVDEWITKRSRESFFQPEFENLGLEPVYAWERIREVSGTATNVNVLNNQLVGYRPRNQVYKLSIDTNHGEFRPVNSQYVGSPKEQGSLIYSISKSVGLHTLSDFVVHSKDSTGLQRGIYKPGSNGVSYAYFKCTPLDLNPLFVQQYSVVGSQTEDQFFMYLEFDTPVIQNMSVHGQPRF